MRHPRSFPQLAAIMFTLIFAALGGIRPALASAPRQHVTFDKGFPAKLRPVVERFVAIIRSDSKAAMAGVSREGDAVFAFWQGSKVKGRWLKQSFSAYYDRKHHTISVMEENALVDCVGKRVRGRWTWGTCVAHDPTLAE